MRFALVMAVVAGAGACERSARTAEEKDRPPPGPTRDASGRADAAGGPDANVQKLLDELEPKQPPPPPIVRRKPPQGDCRTAYAPRPSRDPNPMCKVDGGTFVMSGDRTVTVKPFYIDQFEVTAKQAALFLNAHGNDCGARAGGSRPESNVCVSSVGDRLQSTVRRRDGVFEPRPGADERPVFFTPGGALRYCAWVGKVVPTEAQWEYAARHDPRTGRDRLYPWGDRDDPERYQSIESATTPPGTVGRFDGSGGRKDGSSPWGLYDVYGGFGDIVFQCTDPDAACGLACDCTPHHRGYGSPDLSADIYEGRSDGGEARCALIAPAP